MSGHVHAALMAEYAKDAAETDRPWTRWQFRHSDNDRWWEFEYESTPNFSPSVQYRRKPRTIRIGEFDVPEPMRTEPQLDSIYYTPKLSCGDELPKRDQARWTRHPLDFERLRNGLCHATREAAELHANALISLTQVRS